MQAGPGGPTHLDGSGIAEVPGLLGVRLYRASEQAAIAGAEALPMRALADRLRSQAAAHPGGKPAGEKQ